MRKLIDKFRMTAAFDPDTVHVMGAAFDRAWSSLQAGGAPLSMRDTERARDILGKYIIEAAEKGERDEMLLCDGALHRLAKSKLKQTG